MVSSEFLLHFHVSPGAKDVVRMIMIGQKSSYISQVSMTFLRESNFSQMDKLDSIKSQTIFKFAKQMNP